MSKLNPSRQKISVDIFCDVVITDFVEVEIYERIIEAKGEIDGIAKVDGVSRLVILLKGRRFGDLLEKGLQINCKYNGTPSVIRFGKRESVSDKISWMLGIRNP